MNQNSNFQVNKSDLITNDTRLAAKRLLDPKLDNGTRKLLVAEIATTPHGFNNPLEATTKTFSSSNIAAFDALQKKDFSYKPARELAEFVIAQPLGFKGNGHDLQKLRNLEVAAAYSVIDGLDFDNMRSDDFRELMHETQRHEVSKVKPKQVAPTNSNLDYGLDFL